MKRCVECQVERPVTAFYRNAARRDGLEQRCKPCSKARSKTPRARENWRKAQQRRKQETFDLLGGVCACCGEAELAFLTVDHINNDGQADGVYGDHLYRIVRSDPARFRLLCWNCNAGRRHGLCPHELVSVFVPETWPTLRALGF